MYWLCIIEIKTELLHLCDQASHALGWNRDKCHLAIHKQIVDELRQSTTLTESIQNDPN